MSSIRKLEEKDIDILSTRLWTNAFPAEGVGDEAIEGRRGFANVIINKLPEFNLYGQFSEDQLLGAIVLTDYTVNLHSTKTLMGGLRAISVDLMYKKEKVGLELVKFACSHYRERGSCIIALYPFRTDFYRRMGFGYGTTLREYKVEPQYVPNYHSKEHLIYWDNHNERKAILDCYQRFADKNHGMCYKLGPDIRNLFGPETRIVAYQKEGKVAGYIRFSFKTTPEYQNYLVIHELIYETHNAFQELCTFLHTQADQFDSIIFQTQDEYLHYNFTNPGNGFLSYTNPENINFCVSAVGMMYRIIDVKRYFEILRNHNFNYQTCRLKIHINDNFFTPNQGSTVIHFTDGIATITDDRQYDTEITLDIADFSSLAMGAVDFRSLLKYGLASISDQNYIETVARIFWAPEKPVCSTFF